jgi:predicted ATPase
VRQAERGGTEAVETWCSQALNIARCRQVRSPELRASVYGWFTEGFDTADLQEAKGLLDELS